MPQTISRMYATQSQAKKAFDELKESGYDDVHMIPGPTESGRSRDGIIAALTQKAYVDKDDAVIYADRILKGGTLVTVHTVFSTALNAKLTMDSHNPVDSGISEPDYSGPIWNEALPISSILRMPLLSKTQLPFEAMWNVPSITSQHIFSSELVGFPLLSQSATPFSKTMGLPLLSGSATPLSSLLGIPLLTK